MRILNLCAVGKFQTVNPGCPPSQSHTFWSTAIRQDIRVALYFCSCGLRWRSTECVLLSYSTGRHRRLMSAIASNAPVNPPRTSSQVWEENIVTKLFRSWIDRSLHAIKRCIELQIMSMLCCTFVVYRYVCDNCEYWWHSVFIIFSGY